MTEHRRSDSVPLLAADLRRLRLAAGNPTLARIQSETGVSRSVLSEAFIGRTLPSVRTVVSIVQTCGGGPVEPWIERRDALSQRAQDLGAHGGRRDDRARDGAIAAVALGMGAVLAVLGRGVVAMLRRRGLR